MHPQSQDLFLHPNVAGYPLLTLPTLLSHENLRRPTRRGTDFVTNRLFTHVDVGLLRKLQAVPFEIWGHSSGQVTTIPVSKPERGQPVVQARQASKATAGPLNE